MSPEDRRTIYEYALQDLQSWSADKGCFRFEAANNESHAIMCQHSARSVADLVTGYLNVVKKFESASMDGEQPIADAFRGDLDSESLCSTVASGTYDYGASRGGGSNSRSNLNASVKLDKVNVIDIKTARMAIQQLFDMLKNSDNLKLLSVDQSSLTADTVKYNSLSILDDIDQGLKKLLDSTEVQVLELPLVNAHTKVLIANTVKLCKLLNNLIALHTSSSDILVSKFLMFLESISDFLRHLQMTVNNPHDMKTREELEYRTKTCSYVVLLLKCVLENKLNDKPSEELYIQLFSQLDNEMQNLISFVHSLMKMIKNGDMIRQCVTLTKALTGAYSLFYKAAHILSPVLIDQNALKSIYQLSNEVSKAATSILDYFHATSLGRELLNELNFKMAEMNQCLNQVLNVLTLVEPRCTVVLDFSVPYDRVLEGLNQLRNAGDEMTKIMSSIKYIVNSTEALLEQSHVMLEYSDAAFSRRINNMITSIKKSLQNLVQWGTQLNSRPKLSGVSNSGISRSSQDESWSILEMLVHELMLDVGASAATMNLRYRSKELVTQVLKLVQYLSVIVPSIEDNSMKAQASQYTDLAYRFMLDLLNGLRQATTEHQNMEVQLRLLHLSQRTLMPTSQLIALCKHIALVVNNTEQKQPLILLLNSLSDTMSALVSAIKNTGQLEDQKDIEEALEQFEATLADLEAAEMSALNMSLISTAGNTREGSLMLYDQAVLQLTKDFDNMVMICIKEAQTIYLGDLTRTLAGTVSQVAAAVKSVACMTNNKGAQKLMLSNAKRFTRSVMNAMNSLRAFACKRYDQSLQNTFVISQREVAESLDILSGSIRGMDIRMAGDALKCIAQESLRLHSVIPSSSFDQVQYMAAFRVASEMAQSVNAAVTQLVNLSQANPNLIGSSARLVSNVVKQFIDTAVNVASLLTGDASSHLGQASLALTDASKSVILITEMATLNQDTDSYHKIKEALDELANCVTHFCQFGEKLNPLVEFINQLVRMEAYAVRPSRSLDRVKLSAQPVTPEALADALESVMGPVDKCLKAYSQTTMSVNMTYSQSVLDGIQGMMRLVINGYYHANYAGKRSVSIPDLIVEQLRAVNEWQAAYDCANQELSAVDARTTQAVQELMGRLTEACHLSMNDLSEEKQRALSEGARSLADIDFCEQLSTNGDSSEVAGKVMQEVQKLESVCSELDLARVDLSWVPSQDARLPKESMAQVLRASCAMVGALSRIWSVFSSGTVSTADGSSNQMATLSQHIACYNCAVEQYKSSLSRTKEAELDQHMVEVLEWLESTLAQYDARCLEKEAQFGSSESSPDQTRVDYEQLHNDLVKMIGRLTRVLFDLNETQIEDIQSILRAADSLKQVIPPWIDAVIACAVQNVSVSMRNALISTAKRTLDRVLILLQDAYKTSKNHKKSGQVKDACEASLEGVSIATSDIVALLKNNLVTYSQINGVLDQWKKITEGLEVWLETVDSVAGAGANVDLQAASSSVEQLDQVERKLGALDEQVSKLLHRTQHGIQQPVQVLEQIQSLVQSISESVQLSAKQLQSNNRVSEGAGLMIAQSRLIKTLRLIGEQFKDGVIFVITIGGSSKPQSSKASAKSALKLGHPLVKEWTESLGGMTKKVQAAIEAFEELKAVPAAEPVPEPYLQPSALEPVHELVAVLNRQLICAKLNMLGEDEYVVLLSKTEFEKAPRSFDAMQKLVMARLNLILESLMPLVTCLMSSQGLEEVRESLKTLIPTFVQFVRSADYAAVLLDHVEHQERILMETRNTASEFYNFLSYLSGVNSNSPTGQLDIVVVSDHMSELQSRFAAFRQVVEGVYAAYVDVESSLDRLESTLHQVPFQLFTPKVSGALTPESAQQMLGSLKSQSQALANQLCSLVHPGSKTEYFKVIKDDLASLEEVVRLMCLLDSSNCTSIYKQLGPEMTKWVKVLKQMCQEKYRHDASLTDGLERATLSMLKAIQAEIERIAEKFQEEANRQRASAEKEAEAKKQAEQRGEKALASGSRAATVQEATVREATVREATVQEATVRAATVQAAVSGGGSSEPPAGEGVEKEVEAPRVEILKPEVIKAPQGAPSDGVQDRRYLYVNYDKQVARFRGLVQGEKRSSPGEVESKASRPTGPAQDSPRAPTASAASAAVKPSEPSEPSGPSASSPSKPAAAASPVASKGAQQSAPAAASPAVGASQQNKSHRVSSRLQERVKFLASAATQANGGVNPFCAAPASLSRSNSYIMGSGLSYRKDRPCQEQLESILSFLGDLLTSQLHSSRSVIAQRRIYSKVEGFERRSYWILDSVQGFTRALTYLFQALVVHYPLQQLPQDSEKKLLIHCYQIQDSAVESARVMNSVLSGKEELDSLLSQLNGDVMVNVEAVSGFFSTGAASSMIKLAVKLAQTHVDRLNHTETHCAADLLPDDDWNVTNLKGKLEALELEIHQYKKANCPPPA
ncbi:talin-A-like [Schistocerca gregaria]|uniref:talin-A-like n=1 Tax=Schistocerca gregaria TaxID=7010 RepID=UPI00211DBDD3|nr:talin-A-like [Schistocerca gregaria]